MRFLTYLQNCFLLLLPILLWNQLLHKRLPDAYQNEKWDRVHPAIGITEHLMRFFLFAGTLLLKLELKLIVQIVGLLLYVVGSLSYFASWIMQIRFPTTKWSSSVLGFSAAAYTTILWLLGIGLIGQQLTIHVRYRPWIYIVLVIGFVFVHSFHAVRVYIDNREKVNSKKIGSIQQANGSRRKEK